VTLWWLSGGALGAGAPTGASGGSAGLPETRWAVRRLDREALGFDPDLPERPGDPESDGWRIACTFFPGTHWPEREVDAVVATLWGSAGRDGGQRWWEKDQKGLARGWEPFDCRSFSNAQPRVNSPTSNSVHEASRSTPL